MIDDSQRAELLEPQVVKVSQFVGVDDADIENLLPVGFHWTCARRGVPEEHPSKGIYAAIKEANLRSGMGDTGRTGAKSRLAEPIAGS